MDNPVDPYEASFKGSTFWGKPYAESDNIYLFCVFSSLPDHTRSVFLYIRYFIYLHHYINK